MISPFRALAVALRRVLGRSRHNADGPLDSVVLLLDEVPAFSDTEIVDAIKRAFPVNAPEMLPVGELPPPDYAPDAPPCRSVPFAVNRRVFGLLIGSFPYAQSTGDPDDPSLERSTVQAFVSHRGWVGVDFVAGETPEDMFGLLGQIAAELVTPRTSLVFIPSLSLVGHPTAELVAAMREGRWIDRLELLAPPMLRSRPENEEALIAAAHEARARFPEFVEAFSAGAGREFSAKFPFTDGVRTEHMWVAVESINGDAILGTLGNQPGVVGHIREGDPVTRTLDELEDWLYMDGETMVGGFSVRVLLGEGDGKP